MVVNRATIFLRRPEKGKALVWALPSVLNYKCQYLVELQHVTVILN